MALASALGFGLTFGLRVSCEFDLSLHTMEIGRNDPCACGSGKKYKKCCLQKDVASVARPALDFSYESNLVIRGKMTEEIDQMILDIATKPLMERFIGEYWRTPFLKEQELEALSKNPQAAQALEGQLPHALRSALKIDGDFPVDFFLSRDTSKYSIKEVYFLRDFSNARLTYMQLKEIFPEKGYAVMVDLFDGTAFNVYDKNLSLTLKVHDIVGGRLVPFSEKGAHVYEILGSCLIMPNQKDMLLELVFQEVDKILRNVQPGRKQAPTPTEILKVLKYQPMIFFWMDMRIWFESVFAPPPSLANIDGDDLIFIKARFACEDIVGLKNALLKQKNFEHTIQKKQDIFSWMNQKEYVTGTLRLDAKLGEAHLETNSRERFKKWEKKLRSLGEVKLLTKNEETMESVQKKSPSSQSSGIHEQEFGTPTKGMLMKGIPAQGKISPAELLQLKPELEAYFTERWLKEKIPALGNRTPGEAAKSPEGRKQLKDLLDYIENQDARLPAGGIGGFNVDKMRERFGIKS